MRKSFFFGALTTFHTTIGLLILLGHITSISGVERCTELDKNNVTVTQQMDYVDRDYNLQCCFSGYQITWMKNGRPLIKVDSLANRYDLLENNRTLMIYALRHDDAGNYTCVVKRLNATSRTKTVIFKVLPVPTKKPVFSVRMANIPVSVSDGENVNLECYITSRNRPSVLWYRVNSTAKKSDGSYSKTFLWRDRPSKESDLFVSRYELTNLTVGDSGVYECFASTYDPRRVTAKDNRTLKVEASNSQDRVIGPEGNGKNETPLIIGTVIAGSVLLLAIALALFCWLRRRSEEEFDPEVTQSLIKTRSSCKANNHNTNAQDDKGDDDCICHEVKDVFISYSNKDGDWVSTELLPKLKENYKVCWDIEDFKVGYTIMDNIANSIWRSRKTLLVVTKNFLESDWTKFELTVAQGRDITEENILIMIVVEELEQSQLPSKLKHYYKSRTYLEWCNEKVRPHFWERLRSAIGPSLTELDVINGNAERSTDTDADAGVADASVTDAGVADASVAEAGVANAGIADAGVAETFPETDLTIGAKVDRDTNASATAEDKNDADADTGSDTIMVSCDDDNRVKFSLDAIAVANADTCTGVSYKTNGDLRSGNATGNCISAVGSKKPIADGDCNETVDMK